MKPNHVTVGLCLKQREVTYCVGPHHILQRPLSHDGHKLCHNGMSLMGLQIIQVNCSQNLYAFICVPVYHIVVTAVNFVSVALGIAFFYNWECRSNIWHFQEQRVARYTFPDIRTLYQMRILVYLTTTWTNLIFVT